jgi:hypothetical protein
MHRPEKWGYVQFTKLEPGRRDFIPDPAAPARATLQEVYYAQKDFYKTHQRWAASLTELGLGNLKDATFAQPPTIQVTPEGFTANVELKLPDNKTQRWHIRQDALVWSE